MSNAHRDTGLAEAEVPATDAQLQAWLMQADQARRHGEHQSGAVWAEQAARRAVAGGRDDQAAHALALLALHRVRLGQLEAAVAACNLALGHLDTAPDPARQAQVQTTLALACESAGLIGQAQSHARAALACAQAAGDLKAECGAWIRLCTSSDIVDDTDDADDAGLACSAKALALALGLGSAEDVFAARSNRVHRLLTLADRRAEGDTAAALLQAAADDALAALQEARRSGHRFARALAHCNLAGVLRRRGQVPQARRHFHAARALARHHGFDALANTAELALATTDVDLAPGPDTIRVLAAELARDGARPALDLVLRARRSLVQAYRRCGDLAAALDHLESLHTLELSQRAVRADLQARLLMQQAEHDRALRRAERARHESDLQRLRADDQAQLAQQLEHRVAERTAELQQALVLAEAAKRAKSAFLSNVSHELRTPLNGLLGVAELVLRRTRDPAQADTLRMGVAAGWRLRDLINDILELTLLESSRVVLNPEAFEPSALLHELAQACQADAGARGFTVLVEVMPGVPVRAFADTQRLRKVLQIYLDNAIKFASRGPLVLRAQLTPANPGPVRLQLAVEDAGPGVDDMLLKRLFQPFSMGDETSTRTQGGLGLGLALARLMAELMGGQAGATSVPGQGSSFWVQLPLGT